MCFHLIAESNHAKMHCRNSAPQESSHVQILEGHQEPLVLEISRWS